MRTQIQNFNTQETARKSSLLTVANFSNNLWSALNNARNGDAEAMYILGWCYFKGKYLTQDFTKSMYWLEKAKALGDTRAEELMVYCRFLQIAEWSRDAKKT